MTKLEEPQKSQEKKSKDLENFKKMKNRKNSNKKIIEKGHRTEASKKYKERMPEDFNKMKNFEKSQEFKIPQNLKSLEKSQKKIYDLCSNHFHDFKFAHYRLNIFSRTFFLVPA